MLNPFLELEETPEPTKKVQVRPFYWREDSEAGRKTNILGPFIRYRSSESLRRLQILPNVFYTARVEPGKPRTWFFTFFPLVFLGHNDFLILPIGGYTSGLLGIDELVLVTPFYARARLFSGPPEDPVVYTVHNVFWPFVAWGTDNQPGGRRKVRVAPFYGYKRWRGGQESGFVMWPFFSWRRTETSYGYLIFPFYGRTENPTARETTILFPLYHHSVNYLTGARDTALWPFWRRATGTPLLEVWRYWPLYEFRRAGFTTTAYVCWPFWRRTYVDEEDRFARWSWFLPFYKQLHEVSRRDGREHKKTVVWPIVRTERYADGGREVVLPVLSPFDGDAIREFAEPIRPFISIYHTRLRARGERETTAAFGLYMARSSGPWRKVRLLAGLVGWDRRPEGRYLRLLWGIRLRLGDVN